MKTCLTFTIRHRSEPLHLCYESGDAAELALREFASDIDSIPECETVFVSGGRPNGREACVGFLKRDFLSAEKDSLEDWDDAEETEGPIEDDAKPLPHPHEGGGHALEAATKIVKAAATEEA